MAARLEALVERLRTGVPDDVALAIEELRAEGWLSDETLHGVDLGGADLQAMSLRHASLKAVHLAGATLRGADLLRASLQDANLEEADLSAADLTLAHLQNTNLAKADLRGANLFEGSLQGADLTGANLRGATLEEPGYGRAMFDANSRLPDGSRWVPQTDFTRFTDPDHPDFYAVP